MTAQLCPVCDSGNLTPKIYSDEFDYKGESVLVENLDCMECDVCDSQPILMGQILSNQKKIADAKRKAVGLLTGGEIVGIRKSLGMTQKEAARVFGGGLNAFSKYERGDVIQSEPMDKLLRLVSSSLALSNPTLFLDIISGSVNQLVEGYDVDFVVSCKRKIHPREIPVREAQFSNTSELYDWSYSNCLRA